MKIQTIIKQSIYDVERQILGCNITENWENVKVSTTIDTVKVTLHYKIGLLDRIYIVTNDREEYTIDRKSNLLYMGKLENFIKGFPITLTIDDVADKCIMFK